MATGVVPARRFLLAGVVLLHVAVLLAALSVPGHALLDALEALFQASDVERLATIVNTDRWLTLLGNTLVVCGVAVVTAVLLGGVYGGLLVRTDLPGRTLILGGAALGACTPAYVSAVFIFSFVSVSTFSESAVACGVIHGLLYTPLATLVLAATFRAADRDLEEQALLDASMPWVVLRVTLPHAGWGIAALAALLTFLVATDHTIADILMVRTFAEEVFTQFQLHRAAGGPLITSVPLFFALAVLMGVFLGRYRLFGESGVWNFGSRPRTIGLGRGRTLLGLGLLLLPAALVVVPARELLRRIGSIEAFLERADVMKGEWLLSICLAAGGALIVVCAAVGLAWFAVRGGRWRGVVCVAAIILLAMPAPAVGISLIGMLDRPGLAGMIYDSPLVVMIGYVVRFLPFGVLLLMPAVQRVPVELEMAARIDGCDWLATQRHVYWPAVLTHVGVVWLILVILCVGELGTTALVRPPGWETMSIRFATLIHYGVYRDLAVLAVLSIGGIVLPWLLLVAALRRKLALSEGR